MNDREKQAVVVDVSMSFGELKELQALLHDGMLADFLRHADEFSKNNGIRTHLTVRSYKWFQQCSRWDRMDDKLRDAFDKAKALGEAPDEKTTDTP